MSESRGFSLRKKKTQKRPQISEPQLKSSTRPNINGTTLRPARQQSSTTDTADLVKRRYSTRYNQLPRFDGENVPDVPALPVAGNLKRQSQGGSPHRPTTSRTTQPLVIDQSALADPTLQHDQYVTNMLSNASEEEIQDYQGNLRRIKHRNEADIQQTIFQSRTQFIKISKEAETLKSEMGSLRSLLSELTTTLEQSNAAAGVPVEGFASTTQARKLANRSSVANLEAMWNTQLQQLWKRVEKSQKFLPAVPGRHVISESASWVELDSATLQAKRPVAIVLLNDHLLVASKKRKKMDPNVAQTGPAPTKLVAEECWPLQDIMVTDMTKGPAGEAKTASETKAVQSSFRIQAGDKVWTYRHEKRVENAKNDLLLNIRKAQEDLRKASLPAQDSRSSRSDLETLIQRNPSLVTKSDKLNGIASTADKSEILIDVDGTQESLRSIEQSIDDLDIDLALQRSDIAAQKIERLTRAAQNPKNTALTRELISSKINPRATRFANSLLRELIETPSFLDATRQTTSYLIRLGFESRAREAFLSARSQTLLQRQRQCIFDGDLHRYIFGLSYVYFTIIRNTVQIFQASFSQAMMSSVVTWAGGELEVFNQLLRKQLDVLPEGDKMRKECIDVVWTHERDILGVGGLDFREVIGRGLSGINRSDVVKSDRDGSRVAADNARGSSNGPKAVTNGASRPQPGRLLSRDTTTSRNTSQGRSKSRTRDIAGQAM